MGYIGGITHSLTNQLPDTSKNQPPNQPVFLLSDVLTDGKYPTCARYSASWTKWMEGFWDDGEILIDYLEDHPI